MSAPGDSAEHPSFSWPWISSLLGSDVCSLYSQFGDRDRAFRRDMAICIQVEEKLLARKVKRQVEIRTKKDNISMLSNLIRKKQVEVPRMAELRDSRQTYRTFKPPVCSSPTKMQKTFFSSRKLLPMEKIKTLPTQEVAEAWGVRSGQQSFALARVAQSESRQGKRKAEAGVKSCPISQSKGPWCGEKGRPEDKSGEVEIMRRKMVVMQRCLQEEQVRRQVIERRVEEQQELLGRQEENRRRQQQIINQERRKAYEHSQDLLMRDQGREKFDANLHPELYREEPVIELARKQHLVENYQEMLDKKKTVRQYDVKKQNQQPLEMEQAQDMLKQGCELQNRKHRGNHMIEKECLERLRKEPAREQDELEVLCQKLQRKEPSSVQHNMDKHSKELLRMKQAERPNVMQKHQEIVQKERAIEYCEMEHPRQKLPSKEQAGVQNLLKKQHLKLLREEEVEKERCSENHYDYPEILSKGLSRNQNKLKEQNLQGSKPTSFPAPFFGVKNPSKSVCSQQAGLQEDQSRLLQTPLHKLPSRNVAKAGMDQMNRTCRSSSDVRAMSEETAFIPSLHKPTSMTSLTRPRPPVPSSWRAYTVQGMIDSMLVTPHK